MAPRTLPGLGLSGFWDLGEDNWKDANDINLRTLSALTQAVVLSRTTELPGVPADGDIYIVPDDSISNANEIAIRDDGAWVYLVPEEGWRAYVADDNENVQFDGTEWVAFAVAAFALDDLTDVDTTGKAEDDVLTWDGAAWVAAPAPVAANPTESLIIAISDETTAITTGTAKTTFRMPYAFTVTAVRGSLTTAQASGSIFTVDINEAGASILSTKLTIDNTEKTSVTAAIPPVISDGALADDAEITIDVDQIGSGEAAGLKIALIGARP